MKLVVTILQCRRVTLPHVFVRSILPRMRALFPGDIECVIVQHRGNASGGNPRLESNAIDQARLSLVEEWTLAQRYAGAQVVPHTINHLPYPSIPGMHLCARAALERGADFHLWLEDDALVYDQDCGKWPEIFGGREVGAYRDFHHLNSAYLVTRPSYDERIERRLADYAWWTPDKRLESVMRETMRTQRAFLEPSYAVRYHHRYYPHTGLRYVVQALRDWAPEMVPLLDVDFGPGTSDLPAVTPEEFRAHAAAAGAKFMDRVWRIRQKWVERHLLPTSL